MFPDGHSENAVKTQIWIAVSVYVLVAIVRKRLKLEVSLFIRSEGDSLMDVVKSHAFQMMACLQQIKGLSKDDKVMEHGAALAYVETLMNMTTMILQQGASLPQFQSAMNGLMQSQQKANKVKPRQRLRIMDDSELAPR